MLESTLYTRRLRMVSNEVVTAFRKLVDAIQWMLWWCVRYVVVGPEYVKHHHRLIKDDEFVVWTFPSVSSHTRLAHTLHLCCTTGLEHECFGVKTTSLGAAVPFSLSTCELGGRKRREKFKSSSIKLNFTSFLSFQNHLILTYTQEGHNSSKRFEHFE